MKIPSALSIILVIAVISIFCGIMHEVGNYSARLDSIVYPDIILGMSEVGSKIERQYDKDMDELTAMVEEDIEKAVVAARR